MSKDKRKKGCPNEQCENNKKHFLLEASTQRCPKCDSELVFVCPKCFSKIKDSGPNHRYCKNCEADKKDFKDRTKDFGGAIGAGALAVGAVGFKYGPKVMKAAPKLLSLVKNII